MNVGPCKKSRLGLGKEMPCSERGAGLRPVKERTWTLGPWVSTHTTHTSILSPAHRKRDKPGLSEKLS